MRKECNPVRLLGDSSWNFRTKQNEASLFVRRAGFLPHFFIVSSGGFGFGRNIGLGVRATHHARLRRPTNRGCTCVLAFYRRIALRGAAVRADRVHDLCGRNVTRSGCLGILHRISGQSKMRRHCLFAGPGSFRTFFVPAGRSGPASSMRRRTMRGRKGNYHHKAVTGRL